MTKREAREYAWLMDRLMALGLSREDADTLRRISLTLRRWSERECGDSNSYGAWAIEREDNGDGLPYLVHHHFNHGRGKDTISKTRIPDRETGALKRLAAIMAKHPTLRAYHQGDPRGCALYVLTAEQVADRPIDTIYTNGIAIG